MFKLFLNVVIVAFNLFLEVAYVNCMMMMMRLLWWYEFAIFKQTPSVRQLHVL